MYQQHADLYNVADDGLLTLLRQKKCVSFYCVVVMSNILVIFFQRSTRIFGKTQRTSCQAISKGVAISLQVKFLHFSAY